jgi:hypothetical protein
MRFVLPAGLVVALMIVACGETQQAAPPLAADPDAGPLVEDVDAGADSGPAFPAIDFCKACAKGTKSGTLAVSAVIEASGIVASRNHPGIYYVHNDAGDSARFFAIDATGADKGTWNVTGAKAQDWEDISLGPCEPGQPGACLYLGDIGNNAESARNYVIYRVAEPDTHGPGTYSVPAVALPYRYPNGTPNSETMFVHPVTGVITIVTKVSSGASEIFEFPMPLTPGNVATLVSLGKVQPPTGDVQYTAGDVHPGAFGVLLRTYSHTFYFAMAPGQSAGAALLSPPCVVPSAGSGTEAVGWLADGTGYIGLPEGANASITVVKCALPTRRGP